MPMAPALAVLAPELIQHVAYYSAEPLGPPAALHALLLTCRAIHAALAFPAAPYLYARVFRMKFDIAAPRRRFGSAVLRSSMLAHELRRRCAILRRIRRLDIFSPHVRDDLWQAYLMLLENDGRNARQLLDWACLREFATIFLSQRLNECRDENAGWPRESEENTLAVWILWLASDEASIRNEHPDVRNFVLNALQPFVVAPFKYQAFLVPDIHFALPLTGTPRSNPPRCTRTPHGPFPIYRDPSASCITHFGMCLTLAAPPLTPAALLAVHARRQLGIMQPPRRVTARRSMLPSGVMDVTLEDYEEVNNGTLTRCVRRGSASAHAFLDDDHSDRAMEVDLDAGSEPETEDASSTSASFQHEHDWLRIVHSYDPWRDAKIKIRVFTPGMLDGLWAGRMFTYDAPQYAELAQHVSMHPRLARCFGPVGAHGTRMDAHCPATFPEVSPSSPAPFPAMYQAPLFIRLREHHCLAGELPVSWGQHSADSDARVADGLARAWFPPGCAFEERDGKLRIYDPNTEEVLMYETYVPGRANSHAAGGGCARCQSSSPSPSSHFSSSHPPYPTLSASTSYSYFVQLRETAEQIFRENGVGRADTYDEDGDAEPWVDTVENECITDIVVTGETDFEHGRAWGFYKFVGRIRDADGLIVLLRIPEIPNTRGAGMFIFRGYIHSNQNFVGRWRAASEPQDMFTALEGSFSLCKRA